MLDSNLYWIHWNDLLHPLEWDGEAGGQKVNGWTFCQPQSGRSASRTVFGSYNFLIDVRWGGRGGADGRQAGRDVIFCSVSRWSDPSDPLTSAKESHDVRREKPSAPLSLTHKGFCSSHVLIQPVTVAPGSSPSSPSVNLSHFMHFWFCHTQREADRPWKTIDFYDSMNLCSTCSWQDGWARLSSDQ